MLYTGLDAKMERIMTAMVNGYHEDGYYEVTSWFDVDLWWWKLRHFFNGNTMIVKAKPQDNTFEVSVNGIVKNRGQIIPE